MKPSWKIEDGKMKQTKHNIGTISKTRTRRRLGRKSIIFQHAPSTSVVVIKEIRGLGYKIMESNRYIDGIRLCGVVRKFQSGYPLLPT